MTSFRRILSFPYAFHTFKMTVVNTSHTILGANNNFSKLPTQSRYLFINKSMKNEETETEIKKQHDLFRFSYIPKHTNENTDKVKELPQSLMYSSLSDIIKKIQDGPLDYKSMRNLLFGMLRLDRELRSSPGFSTEKDAFIKSIEFEKFAQTLERSMPMASTKFLYLIFQMMHYYQIPDSSIIMQKLHALILDNINKFELPEVIRMYLMIKNKNEKLLEPVRNAFSAYMQHLTSDSLKLIGDLKSISYFASKKEVPFSVREKILKKILFLGFKLKDLDPVMLAWISNPLCSKEFQFLDKTHFLNALKETMDKFQYKDLKIVLGNIINGIRKKVIKYDENMFDTIANCASKYDLWAANAVMTALLNIGHVNYTLADAIAEKLIKSDTKSISVAEFEKMINIFGLIDYKNYLKKNSDNWFELEEILESYIKSGIDFKSLQTPLNLFVLELPSKELVTKALNMVAKALESHEEVPGISLKRACLMYQCHCAMYSSPPENVPEEILSDCSSRLKHLLSFFWKEAMYEAFNGEKYVLEKCKTPFGIIISYAVILGPDQNPINLSSYKKPQHEGSDSLDDFIELGQIQRPPGSKLFGFVEYTQEEAIKFRNVPLLRPEARLITNIHKNLDYRIFHLYLSQKITSVGDRVKILSNIMERELNYSAFKTSRSSATGLINVT